MIRVFVITVSAGGTGAQSAMLSPVIVLPASIGECVVLIGYGADKGLAGRTVASVLMLRAVVRNRGVLFTVISVVVSCFTAGSTGSGSFVPGRVVILPGTVGIAVAHTAVHQLTAVAAVIVPMAARPCGVGRAVTCAPIHQSAAILTVFLPIASVPIGACPGVIADGIIVVGIVVAALRAIAIAVVGVTFGIAAAALVFTAV